jgi:hypothetical protein
MQNDEHDAAPRNDANKQERVDPYNPADGL